MTGRSSVARTTPVLPWSALVLALFIGAGGLGCEMRSHAGSEGETPREHAEEGGAEKQREDQAVSLTAAEIEEFELQVAPTGRATIEQHVELPGAVRANGDRIAHIVPRFAGIVTEVRKQIGDRVKSGETLAVIESSRSLAPYALKTLLDGVIIKKHVTRGEAVTPESQAFVVADLETVWIDLSVYQRDLIRIREGQPARILAGHGLPETQGVVSYVAPVVDERTRTATARIVIDNPDGFWRPGMFATAEVSVDRAEVEIAVPVSALQSLDGETVVFVQDTGGFRPRSVTVGMRDEESAEIREGLSPGEWVVVEGGFTVKSELLRGEFGGGH